MARPCKDGGDAFGEKKAAEADSRQATGCVHTIREGVCVDVALQESFERRNYDDLMFERIAFHLSPVRSLFHDRTRRLTNLAVL